MYNVMVKTALKEETHQVGEDKLKVSLLNLCHDIECLRTASKFLKQRDWSHYYHYTHLLTLLTTAKVECTELALLVVIEVMHR